MLSALHLGNSMSVRWASRHITGGLFPVYCNRGTNGIEGSVSAAVGTTLSENGNVLLIIGDLSFFYDVNALWNNELGGNLRILLLNNNGGKIFHHLDGLNHSPALSDYIAAHHTATAQGICNSFNCHHKAITETTEINEALNWLLATDFNRPAVLEILATNDLSSK
jgi:2-succinyl-5-enolpyruvyl-6-hydroxy-3-cyclohexene-1-carboxylate synthase